MFVFQFSYRKPESVEELERERPRLSIKDARIVLTNADLAQRRAEQNAFRVADSAVKALDIAFG